MDLDANPLSQFEDLVFQLPTVSPLGMDRDVLPCNQPPASFAITAIANHILAFRRRCPMEHPGVYSMMDSLVTEGLEGRKLSI